MVAGKLPENIPDFTGEEEPSRLELKMELNIFLDTFQEHLKLSTLTLRM